MDSAEIELLRNSVQQLLRADDARWLTEKRWFADKGRPISNVDIADVTASELAGVVAILAIAEVQFVDGDSSTYFVPLMSTDDQGDAMEERAREGDIPGLVDAAMQPEFGAWLAALFVTGGSRLVAPSWAVNGAQEISGGFRSQDILVGTPLGAEQSNSSIRVGEDMVVKVLRRLQPGENPEDEVLRELSGSSKAHISSYFGSLYWDEQRGQRFTAAIAQAWVPNRGDGWTWVQDGLRRAVQESRIDPTEIEALRVLGERTAELHLALGAAQGDAFIAKAATTEEVKNTQAAFHKSLNRSEELISQTAGKLPQKLHGKVPEILQAMSRSEGLARGFVEEEGAARIRVHGDYHLGQVLRTLEDDWTIIDFEGEPARSLEERRSRSSALRDVAGMLRSFSYARAVAERDQNYGGVEALLGDWESKARGAFLTGYRATLASRSGDTQLRLVPLADQSFFSALAAWEADKALYEVAYEARNRPEWIDIPLRALVPEMFDQD